MPKYVQVRLKHGFDTLPVILEGTVKAEDGSRFGVVKNPIGVSVIQFCDHSAFDAPYLAASSDTYVDRIDCQQDVKRDLPAQLRELADIIEKHQLSEEEKSGQYDQLITGTGASDF